MTTAGDSLRRSDPEGAGIRRRRRGRGFSYLGTDGAVVTDPRALARIKALVIPPAWQDVWICTLDTRGLGRERGAGHRDPPDRPGFLPPGRRGVLGG